MFKTIFVSHLLQVKIHLRAAGGAPGPAAHRGGAAHRAAAGAIRPSWAPSVRVGPNAMGPGPAGPHL